METKPMLFSVIIPAYNEEKSLPECLRSLQQQTLNKDEFEVIVIDNGSTDKTQEIAQSFAATVLINTQKNVSGLRNLGANKAKGKVLAFIDADCTAFDDWLESAKMYIEDEAVSAWGSPPSVPDEATWVQKSWYHLRKKNAQIVAVDWLESMNLFVRKDTFFSVGGFNESLITCEDVDFSYRIAQQGKILSDSRIRVIHYGEADTIKHFIKKEFWRGISNYSGVFSHRFKWSELSSLLFPIYFAFFLPSVLIWAAMSHYPLIKVLALLALLAPFLGVTFKLLKKKLGVFELLQLQLLIHIYFIVRTLSAFKGLFNQFKK